MKLNLGCGDNTIDGYLNIDKTDIAADIIMDMTEVRYPDETVDEIVIYQALEHIPHQRTVPFLMNCYAMLKRGSKMVIEVPNLTVVCRNVLEQGLTPQWHDNIYGGYYRPQDIDRYPDWEFHRGSIHYQGFTEERLVRVLKEAGFSQIDINPMDKKHPDYRYEENLSVTAWKK